MTVPFAALGAAGNIIQFVDFGCRLLSKTSEIYHSAKGASAENVELDKIGRYLKEFSSDLASSLLLLEDSESAETALADLASSCCSVAEGLLAAVGQVKGPLSRFKSFRRALKSVLGRDKVNELQTRLNSLQATMTTCIMSTIWNQQSEMTATLQHLCNESRTLNNSRTDQLERLMQSTKPFQQIRVFKYTKQALEALRNDLVKLHSTAEQIQTEQFILKSLAYPMMAARHSKIVDAHGRTYEWVFASSSLPMTDPRSSISFLDWLRRDTGIYWVSGKPGSGKSTFMKFVNDHPSTKRALSEWSADLPVMTASFYFWNSGTELQKSQEGLLRSLLLEILSKAPDLIPMLCNSRWNSGTSYYGPWQLSELSQAFKQLKEQATIPLKFCFFIDGLDEYEGNDSDVVSVLKDMVTSPNIKLCLASRPWNVFEDAFGGDVDRKLYLQDVTREDIALFARSHLSHADNDSQRYEGFILEIVTRAQGVFLWVFLAVRSIQEGVINGDTISTLERRLQMLPTELEPFFEYMINSVDSVYQSHMACAFQAALGVKDPLLLLTYSFLDEEDPNFAIELAVGKLEGDEIRKRQSDMRRRLNGRFKGLLETIVVAHETEYFRFRVDFLHRTVRDFLYTGSMQKMLRDRAGGSHNVSMSVCRALLAQIKTLPLSAQPKFKEMVGEQEEAMRILNETMPFALHAECETKNPDIVFMSELERVMQIRQRRSVLRDCPVESQSGFFELTIRTGLVCYVRHRLNSYRGQNSDNSPRWLMYALRQPWTSDKSQHFHPANMVRLLYQHGTKHIRRDRNLIVWRSFLDSFSEWSGTSGSETR